MTTYIYKNFNIELKSLDEALRLFSKKFSTVHEEPQKFVLNFLVRFLIKTQHLKTEQPFHICKNQGNHCHSSEAKIFFRSKI